MNIRNLLFGLIGAFCLLLFLASCEDEAPPVFPEEKTVLKIAYLSSSPDTQDIINDTDTWDVAEELSIQVGVDKAHTNQFGIAVVRAKAVSDNEYIYLRFNWYDSSRSVRPGYWQFEACLGCKTWTQNTDSNNYQTDNPLDPKWYDEDIFGLFIDDGKNGSEGTECATMCHEDTMMYLTGGGNIDAWVWRAGRTDTLGLADDQFWSSEPNPQLRFDAYAINTWNKNGFDEPAYQHKDSLPHTHKGSFLLLSDAVPVVMEQWQGAASGSGIPGYILEPNWDQGGATSRYDVKARSYYDTQQKRWTIVLWRKMNTGNNDDDFEFVQSQKYEASIAIMDHTNQCHSGSKPFTIQF